MSLSRGDRISRDRASTCWRRPGIATLPVLDSGYGGRARSRARRRRLGERGHLRSRKIPTKRPRITQGRTTRAPRHEWFEHGGLHCTSFGPSARRTRCVEARRSSASRVRSGRRRAAGGVFTRAGAAAVVARAATRWGSRDAQLPRRASVRTTTATISYSDVLRADLHGLATSRTKQRPPTPRAHGTTVDEEGRGSRGTKRLNIL